MSTTNGLGSTRGRSNSTISGSDSVNSHTSATSGSFSGRSVDDVTSQVHSYLTGDNNSLALDSISQPDDANNLDAIDLGIEKKSIFSKIRDVVSKRVTLKKLIFLYVPIAVAITTMIALGAGYPIILGVGLAAIYFTGTMIAKYIGRSSIETPELSERKEKRLQLIEEFKAIDDKLVRLNIKQEAQHFKMPTKKDEVDEDKKEIQDPNTLSTWQKIQQKLKIAAPFILGATIISLGIAATVATGGIFGIIAVTAASMIGALCIGKGVTNVLDHIDEKQAFIDSQNKKQVDDTLKAIDSTTGESDIPEDPRDSIQDQILAKPEDLDFDTWRLNDLPEVENIETKNNQDDLPPDLFSATNSSLPSFNLSPANSHLGSTYPFNSDDFPKKTDWEPSARSTLDIDDNGFLRTTSQDDSISDIRKTKATQAANQQQDDPHNLQRFKDAQDKGNDGSTHSQALKELIQGKKKSHWMWYIFPQEKGLGRSEMSQKYGIANKEECLDYIQDPILCIRLINITQEVLKHKDKTLKSIFGSIDERKFHSCMKLFHDTLQDYLSKGNSLPYHLQNDRDIFLQGLQKK